MAGIEDALRFLDPKYIDKAKELLSDPKGSGTGILNTIKDFDPIEAANFVKDKVIETTFGESNVDDMIIGGGVGGETTILPEILTKAGDYALDQAGFPLNVSTLSDIGSAFSDQGTGGVIEVAKNQAVDLIKQGFVNEGIALATQANIPVATILALANNKFTGPIVKGAGNEFANLGYDLTSNFPLFGNQFGNIYDAGLNLFGINRGKDEEPPPPIVIQQPTPDSTPVFTPPPATSNEAEVDYGGSGGGSGGSYGGGEDFGSPFRPSRPSRPDLTNRANGGLVSVSRYLKGR